MKQFALESAKHNPPYALLSEDSIIDQKVTHVTVATSANLMQARVADNAGETSIDWSVLEEFRDLFDGVKGTEMMLNLISAYLEDTPIQLSALQDALEREDKDTFKRVAHTIKSTSAVVGATRLATQCEALEALGSGELLDNITDKVSQVKTEYKQVKTALAKVLSVSNS